MALKEEVKCLLIEIKQALEAHPEQYKSLTEKLMRFLSDLDDKFKPLQRSGTSSSPDNEFLEPKDLTEALTSFNSRVDNGSTSEEEVTAMKSTVCEVQLKLDFFVMEIDNNRRTYNLIPIRESGDVEYISQLGDLILSDLQNHVTKLELFFQVTDRTSSSPPILKPIVFQLLQSQKYAFIFETKQCLIRNSNYEESDRFFIFVVDEFLPMTMIELVKKLVKMEYTDRFWLGKNSYHLQYSVTSLLNRKGLREDMLTLIDEAEIFHFRKDANLKLQKRIQTNWYLRSLPTYSLLARVSETQVLNLNMLAVLLFYVLNDYKLVMIGVKEKRHIMSETIMGLRSALLPIKYTYPTVFAAISQNHNNYIDTPVPSLVALWGSKQLCEQLININEKSIRQSGKFDIPTILIDLNSRIVINKMPSEGEGNTLKYIDTQLKQSEQPKEYHQPDKLPKPKQNIVDKAHKFIFEGLMGGKDPEYRQLEKVFRQTYIYRNYLQTK